jgi:hypothetical protein
MTSRLSVMMVREDPVDGTGAEFFASSGELLRRQRVLVEVHTAVTVDLEVEVAVTHDCVASFPRPVLRERAG